MNSHLFYGRIKKNWYSELDAKKENNPRGGLKITVNKLYIFPYLIEDDLKFVFKVNENQRDWEEYLTIVNRDVYIKETKVSKDLLSTIEILLLSEDGDNQQIALEMYKTIDYYNGK